MTFAISEDSNATAIEAFGQRYKTTVCLAQSMPNLSRVVWKLPDEDYEDIQYYIFNIIREMTTTGRELVIVKPDYESDLWKRMEETGHAAKLKTIYGLS